MKFECLQLVGEINEKMEKEVFNFLTKMPKDVDTIFLFINSSGGVITSAIAIVNYLKLSGKNIVTINVSKCFSAANIIFLCTKKRYFLEHSKFMLRAVSSRDFDEDDLRGLLDFLENFKSSNFVQDDTDEFNLPSEYNFLVKNYLKDHSEIPDEILKKTFDDCECDYYFSEQELIDYKIAKKVSSLEEIINDLN